MASSALIELLKSTAIKYGDFTLSSGETTNWHCDIKEALLHREGAKLISGALIDLMVRPTIRGGGRPHIEGIVGIGLGGAMLVPLLVDTWNRQWPHMPIAGGVIRTDNKEHGSDIPFQGSQHLRNKTVVLVDDVMTTGNSMKTMMLACKEHGIHVGGQVCIVNRMKGSLSNELLALGLDPKWLILGHVFENKG